MHSRFLLTCLFVATLAFSGCVAVVAYEEEKKEKEKQEQQTQSQQRPQY